MRKIIFSACLLILILAEACSHAAEVRLRTVYPSPLAKYNRTVTKCLGVGDNNYDGTLNTSDAPDPTLTGQTDSMWVANNISIGPAFKTSPKARFQVANGNVLLQNPPDGIIINVPYYSFSNMAGNWSREIEFNSWNLSASSSTWNNTTLAIGVAGENQNYSYGYITSNNNISMSFMPTGDVSVGRARAYGKFHVQGGPEMFAGGTGNSTGDLLRIRHDPGYFGAGADAVIIEKTDNDTTVAGGMVFGFSRSNANNTLVNQSGWAVNDTAIMTLRGNGTGGNVGIGTTNPHLPAPNGQNGNIDVNDVWVRAANQWVSQVSPGNFTAGAGSPRSRLIITPYIKHFGVPPYTCDPNMYLDVNVKAGELIKVICTGSAKGAFYSYIVCSNGGIASMIEDPRNGRMNTAGLVMSIKDKWTSFTLFTMFRATANGVARFQMFYFANDMWDWVGGPWGEVAGRSIYAEIYPNQ